MTKYEVCGLRSCPNVPGDEFSGTGFCGKHQAYAAVALQEAAKSVINSLPKPKVAGILATLPEVKDSVLSSYKASVETNGAQWDVMVADIGEIRDELFETLADEGDPALNEVLEAYWSGPSAESDFTEHDVGYIREEVKMLFVEAAGEYQQELAEEFGIEIDNESEMIKDELFDYAVQNFEEGSIYPNVSDMVGLIPADTKTKKVLDRSMGEHWSGPNTAVEWLVKETKVILNQARNEVNDRIYAGQASRRL